MSTDAQNPQYSNPGPLFAAAGDGYANSGADGTPGIHDQAPGVGGGGVIGSGRVSAPYGSSQLPANIGQIPVVQGDTSGMSDDLPAHTSPIAPGPVSGYLSTGAGQGAVAGSHHPNAMSREG